MLWRLARQLSPRRTFRADQAWNHDYASTSMPAAAEPPAYPYALYLATSRRRYKLICLDLDPGDLGAAVVLEDLARLCGLLDAAGWRYAVVISGPTGGRHVWASIPAGVDAEPVARLGRALASLLPSLDWGMLRNPVSGCARPPGAPHRRGGYSRLDPARDPAEQLAALAEGNAPDAVDRLMAVLPPAIRKASARPGKRARSRDIETDAAAAPRLAGPRRALSPAIAALVTSRPANGDYSAHLWRILIGAALARWSRTEVAALAADPKATGLDHLRMFTASRESRRARSATEAAAVLARQWERAVAAAAELAPGQAPDRADRDDDPLVQEVTDTVAAVLAAADDPAMAWRWGTAAGPADYAALLAACRTALASCSLSFALDVRRWSQMSGFAASTMALAAGRLAEPDAFSGPAWLARAEPAEGRLAAVWRLLPIPAEEANPQVIAAKTGDVEKTRTQGNPLPPATTPTPQDPVTRESLAGDIQRIQVHDSHDAWHPAGGLGHHAARLHAALLTGPQTLDQLARHTGTTRTAARARLERLAAAGLAELDASDTARAVDADLDAVAERLGTLGAGEARRIRYMIDRELQEWWEAEQAWRNAPKGEKPKLPRGGRPNPDQHALPLGEAGPLSTYGRFPTRATADGPARADYTAAAAIVRAHLARVEEQALALAA